MKIRYADISFVSKWLLDELELEGKRNRMRMKFIKKLAVKYEEFKEYYQEILKESCNLDDERNPKITKDDNNRDVYDIIDMSKFQSEYDQLINETIYIEENEQNKEMLLTIQEAINNCPTPFKGDKAIDYENIASLFDDIYTD